MITTILNWLESHPWAIIALVVHLSILGTVAYLILLERKIASWVQDRIGPNRVGPKGLLQPIADGLKFILKEDYRPAGVDKWLFTIAPAVMIIVIIISIAVLPWGGIRQNTRNNIDVTGQTDPRAAAAELVAGDIVGGREAIEITQVPAKMNGEDLVEPAHTYASVTYRYPFQIADLNIGALFIIAVLSLAVYGVVLGGWASNNKYSFLGGLRATAQMISYEIPLGLCLLTIVLMYGTLDLAQIVERQTHYWGGIIPAWNVFSQPVTFLMFLVCIHAEANRAPFDLAEAEQELVGGYHTEYSAMRFALFFLAEYAGMITTSAVCVALFFGGWHMPWIEFLPWFSHHSVAGEPAVTTSLAICIIRALVFFGKTLAVVFIFMWVRWSLPRFRFDQLMMLAWRAMIPLSLALLMITAIVIYGFGASRHTMIVPARMGFVLFLANIGLVFVTAAVSRMLPTMADGNRKIMLANSRFTRTPVSAAGGSAA